MSAHNAPEQQTPDKPQHADLVADLRNAVEAVLDHMERLDDGAYYRISESAAVWLTEAWEALDG